MLKRGAAPFLFLFISLMFGWGCGKPPDKTNTSAGDQLPDTCSIPSSWGDKEKAKVKRIDRFFRKEHRARRFNGTVLFAEKGRLIYKECFGYRVRTKEDSLRLGDPFQLASVSKPLTATLILRLWEERKLGLKDSLSEWFKDWPYQGITVKMLLTHRSGLPNYMYFMEGWKNGAHYDNEDVLHRIRNDTPNVYYVPDYRYNYCNTNYCLLALIAERAADTNFRAAMKEKVYEPVNMKKPQELLSLRPVSAKVKGHNKWGSPIEDYPNRAIGDKELYASAKDLYRFDQALRNGELLADSTLKKAYTPQHEDLYDHDNYGLGWRINERDTTDRIIWHNGWWKGFRTYFIRLIERDATIIVLNNTTRGPFLSNKRLIRLLFPQYKVKS